MPSQLAVFVYKTTCGQSNVLRSICAQKTARQNSQTVYFYDESSTNEIQFLVWVTDTIHIVSYVKVHNSALGPRDNGGLLRVHEERGRAAAARGPR